MNKKQQELIEKEFKVNDEFSISRGDYESMPCPMLAWNWTDEKMQELANRVAKELTLYNFGDSDCADRKEQIEDAFWKEMENVAVSMGMEYYEDMEDEEIARLDKEWENIK